MPAERRTCAARIDNLIIDRNLLLHAARPLLTARARAIGGSIRVVIPVIARDTSAVRTPSLADALS